MADLSKFEQYYKLADMLIEKASKEQLAERAKLLALNLAHYKARHGELPLDETVALADMSEPKEAQAQLLTDGIETSASVLGNVCSGLGEENIEARVTPRQEGNLAQHGP